jgi:DNA-directed RNA polymerase specialized sigma subunit
MSINNEIENRKIIDLYFNQHKNIREVCKILGKSSRYVVPIIKERRLRLADNPEQEKELPEVRAYKLFAERKSPKEVVTELNLSGSTVQQYYIQYWKLENMYELNEIYNEMKDNMVHFVELLKFAKKERLTPEEVIGFINMSNDIQGLERQYKQLNVSIVNLESILYERKEELKKLESQRSAATEVIRRKLELIEKVRNPFRTNLTKTEIGTLYGIYQIY